LVLSQVDAATEAARRIAHPRKAVLRHGFLTGHELTWMPEALRILRDELPNVDVMIPVNTRLCLRMAFRKENSMRPFFDGNEGCQPGVRLLAKAWR